jgi:hypothetical protein
MNRSVIFLSLLMAICCDMSCFGAPQSLALIKPAVLIDIRDTARYTNDSAGIENFLISPLDSNKILTVNTNGWAYELNLADGSWERLDHKFGTYAWGLQKGNFFIDPENKNVLWACNFHRGLILYDIAAKNYREIPAVEAFLSICFLKEAVFIGTMHGLYKFDRKSGEANLVSQIGETNVSSIEKVSDSLLLMNGKFLYNYISGNIGDTYSKDEAAAVKKSAFSFELTAFPDNTLTIKSHNIIKRFSYPYYFLKNIIIDENCVWMPCPDLKNGIVRYSYTGNSIDTIPIGYSFSQNTITPYKVVNDVSEICFYNSEAALFFNKSDHTTRTFQVDDISSIHNIYLDPDFLYANTWHSIEIFSRDYIRSVAYNIDRLILEEDGFKRYTDSLQIYKWDNDFVSYYRSYRTIQAKFGLSTNKRIKSALESFRNGAVYKTPCSTKELLELTNTYLDNIQEEDIKASIYLKLVTLSNYEGRLKESLKFDAILKQDFPGYRTAYHIQQMNEVAASYDRIKKISSSAAAPDEKLWKLGNAYYNLFLHVGPETEASTINMKFPFHYFEKLIRQYPGSRYADNAEFMILSHQEGSSHEGGDNSYNLEAIEKYRKFLKKYPGSALTPDVWYAIGRLYFECDADFADKPKYYELAKTFMLKLTSKYPKYSKIKDARNLLQEIEKYLPGVLWDLEIESDKKEYSSIDPVFIFFRLKNISGQPKTITISADKNISNFALWIERYPFDEHATTLERIILERSIGEYIKSKKDTIIGPGKYYSEKWNIKINARDDWSYAPGYFKIETEGRYKINAYSPGNRTDQPIPSNTIWITVSKKSKE